jgi:hypothetical protein
MRATAAGAGPGKEIMSDSPQLIGPGLTSRQERNAMAGFQEDTLASQAAEIKRLQECYRNACAEEERLRGEVDRLRADLETTEGLKSEARGELEEAKETIDRLRALVARLTTTLVPLASAAVGPWFESEIKRAAMLDALVGDDALVRMVPAAGILLHRKDVAPAIEALADPDGQAAEQWMEAKLAEARAVGEKSGSAFDAGYRWTGNEP